MTCFMKKLLPKHHMFVFIKCVKISVFWNSTKLFYQNPKRHIIPSEFPKHKTKRRLQNKQNSAVQNENVIHLKLHLRNLESKAKWCRSDENVQMKLSNSQRGGYKHDSIPSDKQHGNVSLRWLQNQERYHEFSNNTQTVASR